MSVENHKHCQITVLPASGDGSGNGRSWSVLSNLTNLTNLPDNWLDEFLHNSSNITQDFKSVLTIMNRIVADIESKLDALTPEGSSEISSTI